MTIRIPEGGPPPRPIFTASAARTSTITAPATVQLSSDVRHLQQVQQQLVQEESVNNRRIAELQRAIDNGTYRVDSRQLAEKLANFENNL